MTRQAGAEVGPWDLINAVWSSSFRSGTSDRAVTTVLLKAGDGCSGENAKISLTAICKRTCLHRATVIASIRRLEVMGLISRELRPYKTTVYTVRVATLLRQVPNPTSTPNRLGIESDQSSRKGAPLVVEKKHQGGLKGDHYRTSSVPLESRASSVPGEGKHKSQAPRGRGGMLRPGSEDR